MTVTCEMTIDVRVDCPCAVAIVTNEMKGGNARSRNSAASLRMTQREYYRNCPNPDFASNANCHENVGRIALFENTIVQLFLAPIRSCLNECQN